MSGNEGCISEPAPICTDPATSILTCELPAQNSEDAAKMLEVIGSGGAGTGAELWRLGVEMPKIRAEYEHRITQLVAEVERRQASRQSAKEIARWAVQERHQIAIEMRMRSGVGTRVTFEIRDWSKYGAGGRSFDNIEQRYRKTGLSGDALYSRLIQGAKSPNTGISKAAIKGAQYLKHGGRVIVVFSIATTAYTLLTAPEGELERILYLQAGGFIGGATGSGAAVGICLVLGVATGGWGLLACGVVGGLAGGIGGSYAGEGIYYSAHDVESEILDTAVISEEQLGAACMAE